MVLAVACLTLSGPAAALAETYTATSGAVRAEMSYRSLKVGFTDVRIHVERGGAVLVDEPGPRFGPPCKSRCDYWPAYGGRESSILLPNLDADPEREVLAELYTGGANCCLASRIYDFDQATGRYRRIDRNWNTSGHRGAVDLDRDGRSEIVSSDVRFKYRFGCNACTPAPIRIFTLRAGKLRVVTRSFRTSVRRDLRQASREFRRVRRDRLAARGFLAPVIADRYLLGEGAAARRTLRSALRKGYLRGMRGDGVPDGRAYVRALLRFLRRGGYR
jgi:hypothetical protein